jgi:hypothetical protein
MTTTESASQPRLSTDLEMLHARVKGKVAHTCRVEAIAQRPWLRRAADPVSVAVLLYCYSRSIHTFWYRHMLDWGMSGNRTRTMAAPLHYAPASIAHPLGPTFNWCDQSGSPAREVCPSTLSFPARRAEYATINRLGDRYRWSRIDVAIADSVLEQHSGLGGVLLAIGMMEKDGLCVLLGHITAIVAWLFIGLTSVFAVGGFQRLLEFFFAL